MSLTGRPAESAYTLAVRLTLFFVLVFGAVTAVGGTVLYHLVTRHVLSELDNDILREMGEFRSVARRGDLDALRGAFDAYVKASGKDGGFVRLTDRNGNVLVSTSMANWPSVPIPTGAGARELNTVDLPDARLKARLLSEPVAPYGHLQMGISLAETELLFAHFRRYGLVILAVMLTVGAPIGWWLARNALSGVEAVTRAARSVAGGHFSDRVEVAGHGREIDELVRAFNLMVERVQTVMAEMRHINDNIAHDLRSPLTRIRGLAEQAALRGAAVSDDTELAGAIVEECDRLMQVINTMLDIAEAETGIGQLRRETVDVHDLVAGAIELFIGVAEDNGVQLAYEVTAEPGVVQGDRRKLQRVLANLIDNAIKYTPGGGRVLVRAGQSDGRIAFEVSDTGIGIEAKDLPHVFERFYRADQSRHQRGNGLGLSLALAISRTHGGNIAVRSRVGTGSTFTLTLPGDEAGWSTSCDLTNR
jgi:signal transduction histidine kinase